MFFVVSPFIRSSTAFLSLNFFLSLSWLRAIGVAPPTIKGNPWRLAIILAVYAFVFVWLTQQKWQNPKTMPWPIRTPTPVSKARAELHKPLSCIKSVQWPHTAQFVCSLFQTIQLTTIYCLISQQLSLVLLFPKPKQLYACFLRHTLRGGTPLQKSKAHKQKGLCSWKQFGLAWLKGLCPFRLMRWYDSATQLRLTSLHTIFGSDTSSKHICQINVFSSPHSMFIIFFFCSSVLLIYRLNGCY